MDYHSLIIEAPLLGTVIFIVSMFIRYLGKRDEEQRRMVELFTERVAGLEEAQRDSTAATAVLRETVHNLDLTMRETRNIISGKLQSSSD